MRKCIEGGGTLSMDIYVPNGGVPFKFRQLVVAYE
jgi:hypothetical protein